MNSKAETVDAYIAELPDDRKEAFSKLRDTINKAIPKGFKEGMGYGMVGWCVPHSTYPAGYHCDPKQPLPFVSIANQKNFIALYHMGMYLQGGLADWWIAEYPKHSKAKLDMGKSCTRFKKTDDIPYKLIAELMKKMSVKDWIGAYEETLAKSKSKK